MAGVGRLQPIQMGRAGVSSVTVASAERSSGAQSGRRTFVLEAARLFGRLCIRRRVGLAAREGLGVWPIAAQQLQTRDRLLDAWAMPARHPPQHEDRLADLLEPLAPAAQDVGMG